MEQVNQIPDLRISGASILLFAGLFAFLAAIVLRLRPPVVR
jgi:hypothetical protein